MKRWIISWSRLKRKNKELEQKAARYACYIRILRMALSGKPLPYEDELPGFNEAMRARLDD
jgi:hypothetical protein